MRGIRKSWGRQEKRWASEWTMHNRWSCIISFATKYLKLEAFNSFRTDSAFKALVRFHRCWVPTCKSVVSFEYFACKHLSLCMEFRVLPKFPSLDTVIWNGTSSFYHCYCKVVTWFFTTWFTWWNPWMWMCAILSKLDADKCRTKAEISLFRPTIEMHYIRRRFLLCETTIESSNCWWRNFAVERAEEA